MIYCDSRHAELETCCDIPSGPVSGDSCVPGQADVGWEAGRVVRPGLPGTPRAVGSDEAQLWEGEAEAGSVFPGADGIQVPGLRGGEPW